MSAHGPALIPGAVLATLLRHRGPTCGHRLGFAQAAASDTNVDGLQAAVAAVGATQSRPVLTVLAGWEGQAAADWAADWLPVELMNVDHHPVLQKVRFLSYEVERRAGRALAVC